MNRACHTVIWSKKHLALFLSLMCLVCSLSLQAGGKGTRLSALLVNRVNIFSEDEASGNVAFRLLNSLHRTTLEQTIVRVLGVAPGDIISVDDAAGLERKLRKLDIFATVSVQLVEEGDAAGTLIVNTRDRLSVVFGADGSFTGGVGEVGVTIGEQNLFGLGDVVSLSLRRNTNREVSGVLAYRDLHWLGGDKNALYRAGATEEGRFIQLQFEKPFQAMRYGQAVRDRQAVRDSTSWRTLVESVEQDIDYYEGGQSVVQIPQERAVIFGRKLWRRQHRAGVFSRGVSLQFSEYNYQSVRGRDAVTIEQPENNSQLTARLIVGREASARHDKVTGLDTLRYVQDIRLGRKAELQFGAKLTHKSDGTSRLRPVVSGSFSDSYQLYENTYSKISAEFTGELEDRKTSSTASFGMKLYRKLSPAFTLAGRLDYHYADNTSVLPVQYTLGESNGLRGYANRLLSGDRMLRVNLEPRVNLSRKIGVFDLGLVGFFDAGWVMPETDAWRRSAGVGLRLGSNALLGSSVLRMDVAYPLDLDDAGPVFSAAVGQVFTF